MNPGGAGTAGRGTVEKKDKIRILLVDDQVLFREGMRSLLSTQEEIEVVGEASDGRQAVEMASKLKPDLVLMDIRMPGMSGLEATRLIKQRIPDIKVIILTVSDESEDLFEAIKAGAIGYLLKNLKAQELFQRLHGVFRGEAALSPLLAARILEEFARQRQREELEPHEDELTEREREVLELVVRGQSNREIAANLCITEATVKRHLHNILEKLHLQNRAQAAAYAVRKGLVAGRDDTE